MSSLDPSHKQEIDALIADISKNKPQDLLQHCANYFNHRLESERSSHLASTSPHGKMAAADPSPFERTGKTNTIEEEEEERDTFGSPTQTTFRSKDVGSSSSPFSSPFGTAASGAAGGALGGSLFGNWMGKQGVDDEAALASQHPPASNQSGAGRRTSVSAESMQPDAESSNWKPPKHHKTEDQLSRLKTSVASNFLFSHLDEDSFSTVLDALVEKSIPAANIRVINQGDEGDYFYVVEQGEFDIYIHPSGAPEGSDTGNKVATVQPGGSFGELALMYNSPRAATVISQGKGLLWTLDRMTFRRILMTNAFERRKMYEGFLEEVPLFESLKPYERAKIADALETVKFQSGENIITEGEPGNNFYLLESGEAAAYKSGIEKAVKSYKRGDYFGELALLDDKPRAASVVAKSAVKVAKLGRDGFKRLLGPVEGIMRKEDYDARQGRTL